LVSHLGLDGLGRYDVQNPQAGWPEEFCIRRYSSVESSILSLRAIHDSLWDIGAIASFVLVVCSGLLCGARPNMGTRVSGYRRVFGNQRWSQHTWQDDLCEDDRSTL
jgi:hypothetical protein